MSKLKNLIKNFLKQPGYTFMRGIGRFGLMRSLVITSRGLIQKSQNKKYQEDCKNKFNESYFVDLNHVDFVRKLNQDGIAYGLKLPSELVAKIREWSEEKLCYADRDPALGFKLEDHAAAEKKLGKPILLAQYFNSTEESSAINRLANDPVLRWIASRYLGSLPTFVGANIWWTFPVAALQADRDKHAHVYHRDVDDFRFFKFFFYLTDVEVNEGAHICVEASHNNPPKLIVGDPWNLRRYTDEEIEANYPSGNIKEICGEAGIGFAENTLCIHKGSTPKHKERLLLQLQFALFDYGAMHDRRESTSLLRYI
jgi:hypothetical protein